MNKKIVFSLALLSAFAYADSRPELAIDGADACLDGASSVNNLKTCTKLRKNTKDLSIGNGVTSPNDHFYYHCITNEFNSITDSGPYYHLSNLYKRQTTQKHSEKIRYEALRYCGFPYKTTRLATAYLLQTKLGAGKYVCDNDCYKTSQDYVLDLNKAKTTASAVCKGVIDTENKYLGLSGNDVGNLDALSDEDFAKYEAAADQKLQKPVVQDLSTNKSFKRSITLLSKPDNLNADGSNNDRQMFQDYYKEFSTNTTGKVFVSSSKGNKDNYGYVVYLLDQQAPLAQASDSNWYPDIYANFAELIGDYTNYVKGCTDWKDVYNGADHIRREDTNKLLFFKENGNHPSFQGVCDVYRLFHEGNRAGYDHARAKEMLILKNSRIKPENANDYFANYQDTDKWSVNDYLGGVSKCYNYDIEHYKSKYSRASYFDWMNAREFVRDPAYGPSEPRQHWIFSIHKNGNKNGVFSNALTTEPSIELKSYNFSVNVRPSFKVNKQYKSGKLGTVESTIVSELEVKFVPDANTFIITDRANGHAIEKAVRVSNLDDIFIALDNTLMPFNFEDRKVNRWSPVTISYRLTSAEFSVKQTANQNGKVDGKEVKIVKTGLDIPLYAAADSAGKFGLTMHKDSLRKLLEIRENAVAEGNMYEITFTPTEIVEDVIESNQIEDCSQYVNHRCAIIDAKHEFKSRPIYQASGVDIIKGKPGNNVTIILGSEGMPKGATLGTAYIEGSDEAVVKNNQVNSKAKIADKIYTRTSAQDIFLGFKLPSSYITSDKYIKFLDVNGDDLKVDVFVGGLKQEKKIRTENDKTCGGYYKLSNEMILKLHDKLAVSQANKFKFKIAKTDSITDDCVELGEQLSNEFSIRDEEIKYTANTTSLAVGKQNDNLVSFSAENKDDRYGIALAELRVANSAGAVKALHLDNTNAKVLNELSHTSDFVSFGSDGKFKLKAIFPMVSDAKIALAENKFTHEDFKNELCTNTNEVLDKAAANAIGKDGKINCQIPGNVVDINFTASQVGFDKEYNDTTKTKISPFVKDALFKNFVPFSDSAAQRYVVAAQLVNKQGEKFYYSKYDNDSQEISFQLQKQASTNSNKLIVQTNASELSLEAKGSLVSSSSAFTKNYTLSGLNAKFDELLNSLDANTSLSKYDDAVFDAKNYGKITIEVGYPKTYNGKKVSDKFFDVKEASLQFVGNINGAKATGLQANQLIRFQAVELGFKDISSAQTKGLREFALNSGAVSSLQVLESRNNRVVYKDLDKKYINESVKSAFYNNMKNNLEFYSEYSDSSILDAKYKVAADKDEQYFKDTLKYKVTNDSYKYLESGKTFTIEFQK